MIEQLKTYLENHENYSHPLKEIQFIETHISLVCLTGEYVYKIKKPVKFGEILDFRQQSSRQYFCQRELKLNRRLAPAMYLAVVVLGPRGISTELNQEYEYAVKMRQMPQETIMNEILDRGGKVEKEQLEDISSTLVSFYKTTSTVPAGGTLKKVRMKIEENFTTLDNLDGCSRRYKQMVYKFLENHAEDFHRRVSNGCIKDGHGDLQPRNIIITGDDIYIFDCIEFNDLLRQVDIVEDIGFLAMELDKYGLSQESDFFIDSFVEQSGDTHLYKLLDFYKSYRAAVRAKVIYFRITELDPREKDLISQMRGEAERYLTLAYKYMGV